MAELEQFLSYWFTAPLHNTVYCQYFNKRKTIPNEFLSEKEAMKIRRVLEWFFDGSCNPRSEFPYPYLRIFLPQKTADFTDFFFSEVFTNWDPFLRLFLPQKWLILQFFRNICKMGSSFKDFWPKWDPCLRIFGEKVAHLGGTSPYALHVSTPRAGIFEVVIFYWEIIKPAALVK